MDAPREAAAGSSRTTRRDHIHVRFLTGQALSPAITAADATPPSLTDGNEQVRMLADSQDRIELFDARLKQVACHHRHLTRAWGRRP
jgi:hypothetical protein